MNEGRFLLAEIMQGGNFGQYDTRLGSKENEGKLHRYLRMSLRNLRFVKHYPTEALSEPLFRTWFALWKKIHGMAVRSRIIMVHVCLQKKIQYSLTFCKAT